MNAFPSPGTRILMLCGSAMLCVQLATAQGPLRLTYDRVSPPSLLYDNWVSVVLSGPFVDGDAAQFMQRHRIPGTTFGGVEELHLERFVGSGGLLMLDGRAVFDNRDYRLSLGWDDPDLGFARAGLRNFRTWYDGAGGFFPANQAWFAPFEEEMGMDRGKTWVEGGLRLPSLPSLTFSFTRQFRKGDKPSLAWGESTLTGGAGTRSIVPSFWRSDEVRNIYEARAEHALGRTNLGVGARYESADVNNARNMHRRPDEAQDRYLTQQEGYRSDVLNLHAFTQTRLRSDVTLHTSYSYTTLENDLSGSRIYGMGYELSYDPLYPRRQFRDGGFVDLTGIAQRKHHTGSLNLMARPWRHLTVVPSVRLDALSLDGHAFYTETYVGSPPALAPALTPNETRNERSVVDLSGKLEARYTGIPNVLLYASGDWLQGEGDLFEQRIEVDAGEIEMDRASEDRRTTQKYVAGANWHPLRRLNLGVQAYRRHRSVTYEHLESPRGANRYSAFFTEQEMTTDAVNVRIRWRPVNGVTLSSRYDHRRMTNRTGSAELDLARSTDVTAHALSTTATWTPLTRLFLQGNLNYVVNRFETPANDFVEGAADVLLPTRNDYVQAGFASGFAVTATTDLEVQYFYFLADNYIDNSLTGLPLGSGLEEHGISAGIGRQFSPGLRGTLRYMYFFNRDELYGGRNDYDVHMLLTALQYRF